MPSRSVQISVDEDLLREVDADPEAKKLGRSALIRKALRSYLDRKRNRAIDESYRRAYDGKSDEVLADFADLIGVHAWPDE